MDVTTITVAQFQAQFFRDFSYLPAWDSTVTYNVGQTVYYTNGLFYTAIQNGLLDVIPTSDAAKWQQVSANALDYVQPQDITNAFAEAQAVFNTGIYASDAATTLAYLYLSAHYLVNDLRTAAQGLNSSANLLVSARSVGSMSETYDVPPLYRDNPNLAFYATSGYGLKFLSLTLPNLVGNIGTAFGGTNP